MGLFTSPCPVCGDDYDWFLECPDRWCGCGSFLTQEVTWAAYFEDWMLRDYAGASRREVRQLLREWEAETAVLSSTSAIMNHPKVQALLAHPQLEPVWLAGRLIEGIALALINNRCPSINTILLLHRLKCRVHELNSFQHPPEHQGKITLLGQDWVEWSNKTGFCKVLTKAWLLGDE